MDEKPRRRWFRFSLRTMFLLVTSFSLWLGWQTWIVRERSAMRDWLDANGGRVSPTMQGTQLDHEPFIFEQVNTLPFWRRWLGDQSIAAVSLPDFPPPTEQVERAKRLFPEAKVVFKTVKLPPVSRDSVPHR
jgi:hypothetical protein